MLNYASDKLETFEFSYGDVIWFTLGLAVVTFIALTGNVKKYQNK